MQDIKKISLQLEQFVLGRTRPSLRNAEHQVDICETIRSMLITYQKQAKIRSPLRYCFHFMISECYSCDRASARPVSLDHSHVFQNGYVLCVLGLHFHYERTSLHRQSSLFRQATTYQMHETKFTHRPAMRQLYAALCDVTAHCVPCHRVTLTRPKMMDLITRLGKWLIFPRQLLQDFL